MVYIQVLDLKKVELIYGTSFYKSIETGGNVSRALVMIIIYTHTLLVLCQAISMIIYIHTISIVSGYQYDYIYTHY